MCWSGYDSVGSIGVLGLVAADWNVGTAVEF